MINNIEIFSKETAAMNNIDPQGDVLTIAEIRLPYSRRERRKNNQVMQKSASQQSISELDQAE